MIIDSEEQHCKELTDTLRQEDRLEAIHSGLEPQEAVQYCFLRGVYRKTALVNEKVAAMWGVIGTPLGNTGTPYLITGTEALKTSPIRFAKIYLEEARIMNKLFPVLQNYVDMKYHGAVRLLLIAGFNLTGPEMINGNPFYKFTMKDE